MWLYISQGDRVATPARIPLKDLEGWSECRVRSGGGIGGGAVAFHRPNDRHVRGTTSRARTPKFATVRHVWGG